MNKSFILLLFWITSVPYMFSQSYAEYNVRGDQQMQKEDYQGAVIWYREGVEKCDPYSISRLTEIWMDQEDLRQSMNRTMRSCYNCLKSQAEGQELDAMFLLSEYYKLGIGVEADEEQQKYWWSEYGKALGYRTTESEPEVSESISTSSDPSTPPPKKKSLLSDKFYSFVTYTWSPTMPLGLTIGGFDKYGFYLSYRSSEYKRKYDFECDNTQVINTNLITDIRPLYAFDREDWTAEMITGGVLLPLKREKFYLSVGAGYAKRNYFRSILSEDTIIDNKKTAWCHNTEASYESAVVEIGGLWKWKRLIVTGGVNSTGFKDLDGYFSLGVAF